MLPNPETKLVIITGMSGAGKTVAMQSLEDLGYYCVDNLPPTLLQKFIQLACESQGKLHKIAVVMDLRAQVFIEELNQCVSDVIEQKNIDTQIVYLEANDAKLVARYKETRRAHPLSPTNQPLQGIQKERKLLEKMKSRAQMLIDTSGLKPRELRELMMNHFSKTQEQPFSVNFVSFGFKHGVPIDADLMFDVRFLPNPFYIEHMRPMTGKDQEVYDYVMEFKETQTFIAKLGDLIEYMIPQYKREGKSQVIVGIGCTGGQHRSVALSEYFTKRFASRFATVCSHRDIDKRKDH
ncbi:MAG: RNase adapter RapZ [Bacilli bacterium]